MDGSFLTHNFVKIMHLISIIVRGKLLVILVIQYHCSAHVHLLAYIYFINNRSSLAERSSDKSDTIMKESYTVGVINFLKAIKDSPGYWYSVIESPLTQCCLANLLGVSNEELLEIFSVLGLVKIVRKKGLQIKRQQFENFLSVHGCENVSLNVFKIKHTTMYFLWISSRDGQMPFGTMQSFVRTPPPLIDGIAGC